MHARTHAHDTAAAAVMAKSNEFSERDDAAMRGVFTDEYKADMDRWVANAIGVFYWFKSIDDDPCTVLELRDILFLSAERGRCVNVAIFAMLLDAELDGAGDGDVSCEFDLKAGTFSVWGRIPDRVGNLDVRTLAQQYAHISAGHIFEDAKK